MPMPSDPLDTLDEIRLAVAGPWVKAHDESADLVVLFHSGPMARNNPLLALSPYGSLIWREIAGGATVGRLRRAATERFGRDEVLPFLRRLADLEFISPVPAGQESAEPERIPKDYPAPEVQHRLRHAAVPWYCLWEIATRCNLRCRICYVPDFSSFGPDRETALAIVRQIVEAGIFYVCLLGGEPLLRRDLEEVVAALREAHVFVKVITNGLGLDARRAESLAKAGLNQLEVSFDGLSAGSHEASRGAGTFEPARRAVSRAWEAGIPRVGMVWTVHSENLHELPRLPERMAELGVIECYLSPFKKTGLLGAGAPFTPPTSCDLEELRRRLEEWRAELPHLTVVLPSTCSCGRTSVVLGAEGDVRLCSFSSWSVGNLHERPLKEIWRSLGETIPEGGPLGYCAASASRGYGLES
ncbi:MAG TPA: radical SAM protein [Thermoanaerobaculia bacterium]|nr:radical SAM protein [Thermoanaerobaculia bacterium]